MDPVYIENMKTVMDDTKMLTLGNGECIRLENHCAILFEVCKTKLKLNLYDVDVISCPTFILYHLISQCYGRNYPMPMIITYDMSSICNGSFAPCPIMAQTRYYNVWLLRSWPSSFTSDARKCTHSPQQVNRFLHT